MMLFTVEGALKLCTLIFFRSWEYFELQSFPSIYEQMEFSLLEVPSKLYSVLSQEHSKIIGHSDGLTLEIRCQSRFCMKRRLRPRILCWYWARWRHYHSENNEKIIANMFVSRRNKNSTRWVWKAFSRNWLPSRVTLTNHQPMKYVQGAFKLHYTRTYSLHCNLNVSTASNFLFP